MYVCVSLTAKVACTHLGLSLLKRQERNKKKKKRGCVPVKLLDIYYCFLLCRIEISFSPFPFWLLAFLFFLCYISFATFPLLLSHTHSLLPYSCSLVSPCFSSWLHGNCPHQKLHSLLAIPKFSSQFSVLSPDLAMTHDTCASCLSVPLPPLTAIYSSLAVFFSFSPLPFLPLA